MTLAFVFPGQGSQRPGMGRPLADAFSAARAVFEEVDDALDVRLSRIIFEDPDSELTGTHNAQPALLAVSMAVLAVIRQEGGPAAAKPAFVAGHSLGEYCALTAAGSLSLRDAARTLRARGEAMRQAQPGEAGTMSAILGAELDAVERVAEAAAHGTDRICAVANDNAPGQAVVSGHLPAVERAEALSKEAGARRVVRLGVAGAFHSPLMESAAAEMKQVLDAVELSRPGSPVIANVTAQPASDPAEIRGLLLRQITERVRWRETVQVLATVGVTVVAELGPGSVLCGLVRRTAPDLSAVSVETPRDVEAFLAGR